MTADTVPIVAQTIQLSVASVFLLVAMGSFLNICSGRLAIHNIRVSMELREKNGDAV